MRRFSAVSWGALAGGIALVMSMTSTISPAWSQGVVKTKHGDWEVRCDTPPGSPSEQCGVVQSLTAEDRPSVGLSVIAIKTADKKQRVLRILAPLGVLLPSGLGLKIDGEDVGRTGFVRCLPNGCVAEVVMDDSLMEKLGKGKAATFIIFQTPEEGIGIPVALTGFKPAFDSLK